MQVKLNFIIVPEVLRAKEVTGKWVLAKHTHKQIPSIACSPAQFYEAEKMFAVFTAGVSAVVLKHG